MLSIFDIADKIFLSIYITEFLMKVIAYGLEDYFEDDWYPMILIVFRNKFDFFLIFFQLVFDYLFYSLLTQEFVSSFKANRVLRLAKI